MEFIYNDGGRLASGFKGKASDCVCRSIAIVTELPYKQVYDTINKLSNNVTSARTGVYTKTKWFKAFMELLGFKWVSCMQIGKGCKVHLKEGELPHGRLVVAVSKHYTAVLEGDIHDTLSNVARKGTRCVYGYWELQKEFYPKKK